MPVGEVEPVVRHFIADTSNDVLVLKGQWGVGKTHFWHSVIKSASQNKKMGRDSYAYISLFGLNSLDDLRNAIFASRVKASEIGIKDPLSVLQKNAKGLVKHLKLVPKVKDWSAVASTAAFHMINETLVCLDDLERKGKDFDILEILGLVSLLKEHRNCKVAIILNDKSLQDDDLEKFQRHAEKLIDIELNFSQTPEEAFKCAFHTGHPHYEFLSNECSKLGITNIRILQRLQRFVDGLSEWYPKYDDQVKEAILHTLALYVWCYYDKDGNSPSLDYVTRYRFNPFGTLEDTKKTSQQKNWDELLHDYRYLNTDDLDLKIAEYVQKGYVVGEAFGLTLDKKNAEVKTSKGQGYYRRAWDLYQNSFENNEADFVRELISSFRANMQYLSPRDLSGTAQILRNLGRNDEANKLVDEYVASRQGTPKFFDLNSYPFRGDIRDSYVLKKFDEVLANTHDTRTLAEVLERLINKNGWGSEDEIFLSSRSSDDYYGFFKSQNSEDLYHYVKQCLQFGSYQNGSERQQSIANRAREALQRIAAESTINRIRIESLYDVKLMPQAKGPSPEEA